MIYTDQYIKADSFEQFFELCESAGLVADGEIITSSHNHQLDIIGELRKPTGKTLTSDDGTEYQETEVLDGYHVNVRFKESIGLESLSIPVDNPLRGFA